MKMKQPVFWFNEPHERPLTLDREIVVDCFAGGGGASVGLQRGVGHRVDVAINHNKAAIAMHMANHPETKHFCENLWDVDPVEVCEGRKVGAAWFSPDCTHFSKAKGKAPKKKEIRALAWIVVRWAARVRPRVIFLENVEEFVTWGPLDRHGQPVKEDKGKTFDGWVKQLEELGFVVEWRTLVASDYGSPTTRKRLFLVARCDGKPIEWPESTHGSPKVIAKQLKMRGVSKLKTWRTAAEIIDWSIDCPSIFMSPSEAKAIGCKRPLADKTLHRIAEGIRRYVIETNEPFVVKVNHGGFVQALQHGGSHRRMDQPIHTITASQKDCNLVVAPTLMSYYVPKAGNNHRGRGVDQPTPTQTTENRFALVSAFVAKHFGGVTGIPATQPFPTVTTMGTQNQVVAANLIHMNHGAKQWSSCEEPLRVVTAQGTHHAVVESTLNRVDQVRAFLMTYYGNGGKTSPHQPVPTITTKDRLALGIVMLSGEPYQIVDIGMRMLTPRELFNAQGFPSDYIIDVGLNGKPASKKDQVARCGNSVCPHPAAAIVAANYRSKGLKKANRARIDCLTGFGKTILIGNENGLEESQRTLPD